MPDVLPIACSLDATELPERLREMADLGRDALLDARIEATRAQLRFAAGEAVHERLEAVVAAESRCCAFLTMRIVPAADGLLLTIDAPAGADVVLAELVDAFAAGRAEAAR